MHVQIHEAQGTSNRLNLKRVTVRYIIIMTLSKTELGEQREKTDDYGVISHHKLLGPGENGMMYSKYLQTKKTLLARNSRPDTAALQKLQESNT